MKSADFEMQSTNIMLLVEVETGFSFNNNLSGYWFNWNKLMKALSTTMTSMVSRTAMTRDLSRDTASQPQ